MTVALRSPRLTVRVVPVPAAEGTSDLVLDALALAADIRAAAAAAIRVHDLAPRG